MRHIEATAQMSVEAIRGKVDSETWRQLDDAVNQDSQVVFAILEDARGNAVGQNVENAIAYGTFEELRQHEDAWLDVGDAFPLNQSGTLGAVRVTLWTEVPKDPHGDPQATSPNSEIAGYLTIGMTDPGMARLLEQLFLAQIAATLVVCLLAIPFVMIFARRWTHPLQMLTRAAVALSNLERPMLVRSRRRDEIGGLSQAFNRMTERLHHAHVELQEINEQLEQKVHARTAELYQVNERLETEIRDKNEFLRAVSHDLGAPLRNISGMARLLVNKYQERLGEDGTHKLQRIAANADNQSDMINELLELSRIRTKPGEKTHVDLNKTLKQIGESLDFDFQNKGITFVCPDNLPSVWAEANRMRQVFQNLIDNAIKYMGEGAEKTIRIEHIQNGGTQLVFRVSDTGKGIAEEDQPRIFDVFRRATKSGPLEAEGRGVGLASVKSIVETYGGSIKVESKLGEGTTFVLAFGRASVTPPDYIATAA